MNPQMLEDLAAQHRNDLRAAAARQYASAAPTGQARQSLRTRTGWRLVRLGLRLATGPGQRPVTGPVSS